MTDQPDPADEPWPTALSIAEIPRYLRSRDARMRLVGRGFARVHVERLRNVAEYLDDAAREDPPWVHAAGYADRFRVKAAQLEELVNESFEADLAARVIT